MFYSGIKNTYKFFLLFITLIIIGDKYAWCTDTIPQYEIEKYNINSGLSSDYLQGVCQDDEGYLWMASSNGLIRFDGYTGISFKPEFTQKNTFNSLNYTCIDIDSKGNLWIGTDHSGINVFNKETGSVINIDKNDTTGLAIRNNNINNVFSDSKGRVWICSFNGLNMYDTKTDSMFAYSGPGRTGDRYPFGSINCAYEDSKGKILIGTWGNGIYIFNEESNDFHQLRITNNFHSGDSINRVRTILEDKNGDYWLGSWEGGLLKVDLNNYQKVSVLQHYGVIDAEYEILTSDIIYDLYEDKKGRIWAATPYGINIISNHQSKSPHIQIIHSGNNSTELGHNDIFNIYEDNSGIIWIATGGGGLNKIDPGIKKINTYTIPKIEAFQETQTVRSFIIDDEFGLLIGVNGLGFGQYDIKDGSFIQYKDIPRFNDLPETINAVTAFHKDSKGNLWIGTRYKGLFLLEKDSNKVKQFLQNDPVTGDLSRMVNVIYEDQYHSVWIGTNYGLFLMSPHESKNEYQIYRYINNTNNPKAIHGEYISTVFEDSDSTLWVGTVGGAINYAKNLFTEQSSLSFNHIDPNTAGENNIHSNIVYSIYEDSKKRLWIGTGTGNIALLNKQNYSFEYLIDKAGVKEDAVYDILECNNVLWLSTNNGLIRIKDKNQNEFQVEVFNSEDGLQGNYFIDGAFYKAENGDIFAGGYNGFNVFNANEIHSNNFIPPIAITQILVANQAVNVYEALKDGLLIKFKQNNIQIQFSALSFSQPEKNKYAYKLNGLDNEWQQTDSKNRIANYSHLPPGNYTLQIKASNNSDLWNDHALELSIRVKPHPARSWWAVLIYSILLFTIIIIIYYYQINNIKIKQAYEIEKLERKKEENINQFKFRFFTNISHELLTPLSVLTFSIEDLLLKAKKYKDPLEIMDRNVKRIMHLSSQLLDFRKVESGSMSPQVSLGKIDFFVKQILDNLEPIAKRKNISVSVEGVASEMIYFDPDKLDKIFSNLISNALKYTPEKGQIMITYKIYDHAGQNWLLLDVTDSGPGIEPDKINQVFERFYQVKSVTGKTFGAGIGLALAKTLVETHKGQIDIKNKPPLGACFTIHIPVSKEAYNDNEILNEEMNYQVSSLIIDHDESLLPIEENIDSPIKNNQRKTILVVEDNSDFRKLIQEHLSNYYNTLVAENGEQGLQLCLEKQPDMVITDNMMPVMNGVDLCKSIKSNIETSDILVILLTAKTDEETRYESYLANADSYLSKPVNIRTLFTRVESLLEQREKIIQKYTAGDNTSSKVIGLTVMDQELLEEITAIIENKLMNTELNVLALSKEIRMSTSSLYRKITRLTGMSPVEFIRHVRLQAAANMITKDGLNISEAAYASGFNDLSYFSKSFKKQYNMSPKAYQKQHTL